MSIRWVLFGVGAVILAAFALPGILGLGAPALLRLVGSLMILGFAFMFVTVSARIVGLVGVTSNPTSGMAIVTLLGTSLVFYALGWTDDVGKLTVLTIGTVVCVAASIAGDISQDLKCGYIIGATPARQQAVELIGAVTAAFAVAASVLLLGETLIFGSRELPAPQATLIKTVIEGVLQANLPWGLVLVGAALSLVAVLLGVPALPFAVGIYLPAAAMMPVFLGGCLRSLTEWKVRRRGGDVGSSADKGVLLASGLIAGEGLMGVGVAGYAAVAGARPGGWAPEWWSPLETPLAVLIFVLLGLFLLRSTQSGERN